ncbi:MAG TPA: porin [Longimicrobiales bacterium]|nr:porin [Longimicrobiales bacterium]
MKSWVSAASIMLMPAAVGAQADTTTTWSWGGFVDAYYAYHFNLRRPGDAPVLTQPVRHNEFNINLAFVEARLSGDRVRGRLALQVGTSVQANYAGEPTHGAHSGPVLARQIQEAVAGYRLGQGLWLDGGIFLSHIGAESWISRDNWNYSRSLIADYSPYYETGLRATWSPSSKFAGTFALLNGWQNISETNANKAAGIRLDYTASTKLTLSYSNFLGSESPEGDPSRFRFLHDFIVKLIASDRIGFLASFDIGSQGNTVGDEAGNWYGFTAITRVQATARVALAGRFERYADPDGVFLATTLGPGLELNGISVNLDVAPTSHFLWRTEFRSLIAEDEAFVKHDGSLTRSSPFVVSSFAVSF